MAARLAIVASHGAGSRLTSRRSAACHARTNVCCGCVFGEVVAPEHSVRDGVDEAAVPAYSARDGFGVTAPEARRARPGSGDGDEHPPGAGARAGALVPSSLTGIEVTREEVRRRRPIGSRERRASPTARTGPRSRAAYRDVHKRRLGGNDAIENHCRSGARRRGGAGGVRQRHRLQHVVAHRPRTKSAGAQTAVMVSHTELGDVLVEGRGRTLYGFTNDVNGTSTCTGTCAESWFPLTARRELEAGPGCRGCPPAHHQARRRSAPARGRQVAAVHVHGRQRAGRRQRPGQPRKVVRGAARRFVEQGHGTDDDCAGDVRLLISRPLEMLRLLGDNCRRRRAPGLRRRGGEGAGRASPATTSSRRRATPSSRERSPCG